MEGRSTTARRKRAIAARKAARTRRLALRARISQPLQPQLVAEAMAPVADQAQGTPLAEVPVQAMRVVDQEPEHAAIATLELPAPQQDADSVSITWSDTWAAPEADAMDDRSWHWQEPSFDDETSWILMSQPRRGLRDFIMRTLPFSWRERTWSGFHVWRRHTALLLALGSILLVTAAVGILGYRQMLKAAEAVQLPLPSLNGGSAGPNGVVIVPPSGQSTTPTPVAPGYEIGVWVSNSSPSGGSVIVYVRVVHDMQVVPGVSVSLSVSSGGRYSPVRTDRNGIAKFTVRYGGGAGSPVFVTAKATVEGQTIFADTTFTPIGGASWSSGGSSDPTQQGHGHGHGRHN